MESIRQRCENWCYMGPLNVLCTKKLLFQALRRKWVLLLNNFNFTEFVFI